MQRFIRTIDCQKHDPQTHRKKPFRVARFVFFYQSDSADKELIDSIIDKAERLANKVNPGAANHAAQKRNYARILNNCVAGLLAEHLWKSYLNKDRELVVETPFDGAKSQIDLRIITNDKKIEVRSSFPRNGIEFALCSSTHEFDVIGMYSNGYKPDEVQKDYYVRALFHLRKLEDWTTPDGKTVPVIEKIMDKIKTDGFEAWLTGGATWDMMLDDTIAIHKNFIPEDEINIERLHTATSYRVVPFSRALDTVEMGEAIGGEI